MAKVYQSKTRIELFITCRPRSSVPLFPELWGAVQACTCVSVPAKGAQGMNSRRLAVLVKGAPRKPCTLYGRRALLRP
jgi:hypothetical protein